MPAGVSEQCCVLRLKRLNARAILELPNSEMFECVSRHMRQTVFWRSRGLLSLHQLVVTYNIPGDPPTFEMAGAVRDAARGGPDSASLHLVSPRSAR